MITSRSILLTMRNISDKSCRENQITHFIHNNFFFRKSYLLWDNVTKHCTAEQTTNDNITWRMLIACWITKSKKNVLIIRNNYCVSSATIVTRTRLIVTYCLSCFFQWSPGTLVLNSLRHSTLYFSQPYCTIHFLPIILLFDVCAYKYSAFGKSLCTYKRCWKWCPRTKVSKNWIKQLHTLPVLHSNRCLTTEYSETTAHFNGNFDTDNQIYVP
jgi:hypothetical protein